MDEARIRALTEEVLDELRGADAEQVQGLEARVAALEAAVRALQAGGGAAARAPVAPEPAPRAVAAAIVQLAVHPSQQLVTVPGGGDKCVLEPDKPCCQSGQCRSFGH